jgi:hypothetical protein
VYLRKRGIRHVIPEKKDHRAARIRRGSRDGRPPGFDKERYKDRNTVERAIGKLKQFRAVATRYDKRGYVYLGTVTVAALLIWLRSQPERKPGSLLQLEVFQTGCYQQRRELHDGVRSDAVEDIWIGGEEMVKFLGGHPGGEVDTADERHLATGHEKQPSRNEIAQPVAVRWSPPVHFIQRCRVGHCDKEHDRTVVERQGLPRPYSMIQETGPCSINRVGHRRSQRDAQRPVARPMIPCGAIAGSAASGGRCRTPGDTPRARA